MNIYKRIMLFCSVILCLAVTTVAFASCDKGDKYPGKTDTPTESTTEVPTDPESESEEETELKETEFTFLKDGVCYFKILRPDDLYPTPAGICTAFYKKISSFTDSLPDYTTDIIYRGQSIDSTASEFLIGTTNREESTKLCDKIADAKGNRFGILCSEHKIAVAGSNAQMTSYGLKYFIDNFSSVDENGKTLIRIPKNYEYISEDVETSVPDFEEALNAGKKLVFCVTDRVIKLENVSSFPTMQGGGTDGTYAYYGLINKNTEEGVILKYDLKTWELVKKSEPIPTGHTNDITYDPINKRLVISYCLAKDGYKGICFVDAETLEFQSYMQTPVGQRAVEYLPKTNQYLLGTNYFFTLVEADLKTRVSSFNCGSGRYVTQGMCADDKYLYDVRWLSGSSVQYIVVHGLDGKYYGEIEFHGVSGEPENMFRIGDKFYVGCNQTNTVFEVELIEENIY